MGPSLYALDKNGHYYAFQPVLYYVFCLLVTPQTLDGQTFLEV